MKKLLLVALLSAGTASAQTFTNYTTTEGLLNNNVSCLDVAASDVLWFGTQAGVSVFDGTNWTEHSTSTDVGIVDNNITAICALSSGEVWIGTDFGACHYDGTSWTTYTTTDGLGNNQIKCIEEDAQGNVWFGTNNGASQFDGSTWMNLGTADGLPFGGVVSITFDSNGDVWLGSGLGGVAVYDGSLTLLTNASHGIIDNRSRALAMDNQNNRWVGTSAGISVLNSSNVHTAYHTQIYTLPAPDTLNPIEDIEVDNFGNVWVGVYVDYLVTEGGVCAFDGSHWTEYHPSDGLVGPVVRALAIDSQNNVWVATSTGVSKLSDHNVGTENRENDEFALYPNPASQDIILEWKNESPDFVSVYSADLKKVKEVSIPTGSYKAQISVADLPSGIYFVEAGNSLERLVKR